MQLNSFSVLKYGIVLALGVIAGASLALTFQKHRNSNGKLQLRLLESREELSVLTVNASLDSRPFSFPSEGRPKIIVKIRNTSSDTVALAERYVRGHPSGVWTVHDAERTELAVSPFHEPKGGLLVIHPNSELIFELEDWPNCDELNRHKLDSFAPGTYSMNMTKLPSNTVDFLLRTDGTIVAN